MGRRLRIVLLAGVFLMPLAACGSDMRSGSNGAVGKAPAATITELDSVLDLRAAFNRDAGTPRLLLLLSPT